MKLDAPSIPVEIGGVQAQGEFRIKNSAVAFSILSSGLYSNKFKAILRELGCNAYDSHVEAGHPEKPFTVHLPTRLNPILSIRDYGTGLSHEQIMNLYTTYFESTKNDSNDFVGCMGLGSKSPFSYTKNFTITAWKDGKKGIYSAFIGDLGVPNIVQLLSEDSDELTGLEVSFPVENTSDMYQFRHEAGDTYKWFKTHPEMTGDEVTIPTIKYSEENIIDGVSLSEYTGQNRSFAVMGNVAYPINIPRGEDVSSDVRQLFHNNRFVVRFNIGDLSIAASREELGYDSHTVKNLADKAELIMQALEEYVGEKLSKAKTKWERNILAGKLIESNGGLFGAIVERYVTNHPRRFVKGSMKKYSGVNFTVPLEELSAVKGLNASYKIIRHSYGSTPARLAKISTLMENKPKHLHRKKPKGTLAYHTTNRWEVYDIDPYTTTIVFNDEPGNVLQRIRMAATDKDYKVLLASNRLLIFSAQNKDVDKAKLLKFVKTRLGNAPIVLASQLPEIVKGSGLNGNTQITVQRFARKRSSARGQQERTFETVYGKVKDLVPTIEKNKKKIYLYLKLSHKGIIKPQQGKIERTWDATKLWNILIDNDLMKIVGISLDNVYGVNKTSYKTITASSEWVNFFDYLQEKFDKIDWKSARKDAERALIKSEFASRHFNGHRAKGDAFDEIIKTNTPASEVFKEWNKYTATIPVGESKAHRQAATKYERVILGMGKIFQETDFAKSSAKLDANKIEEKFAALFTAFKIQYPMLEYISLDDMHYNSNYWDKALEYIKLVDKST